MSKLASTSPTSAGGMDRRVERRWRMTPAQRWAAGVAALAAAGLLAWALSPRAGTVDVDAAGLSFGTVVRAPYLDYAPLRAEVAPAQTTFIAAETAGRVEAVLAADGDLVAAGQELARLSNPQLSLEVTSREADIAARLSENTGRLMSLKGAEENREQALADTAHALSRARQDLDRRQILLAKAMLSPSAVQPYLEEVDYQKNRLATLRAAQRSDAAFYAEQRAQAARSAQDLRRSLEETRAGRSALVVRAPTAGRLTAFDLKPGQAVRMGDPLGQVDAEGAYKLRAKLDEFYLPRLSAGQSATATVRDHAVSARVTKVFPQIAEGRATLELAFDGAAPQGLRRGETIDLRLSLGRPQAAVVAPSGAWLNDTGGAWAFALSADGKRAERRAIVLGRRNPEQAEVLSGLKPGERIVTAGAQDVAKAKILRIRSKGRP
ncbi:HlyD family efflux transporter periplasmic adaptor subunit [Caulobacter sp. BE254]|uniref:efflux RND transporter periplasmic adaptor subunit n=1 Tax=Caulobacter sp. BE254 TaxID=2817720 RepID=UPI00285A8779|nr:HlyD family efflux transporter periplasmic adaptor subunit [Caulobacter sp. BE254]MDR7117461.1 HlyD family secretion protein [Caulobacter sp. BE254]